MTTHNMAQNIMCNFDTCGAEGVVNICETSSKSRYPNLKEILRNRHNESQFGLSNGSTDAISQPQYRAANQSRDSKLITSSPEDIATLATTIRSLAASIESPMNERLEDSPIIIAAGYGVGGKECFDRLRELAKIVGARIGSTRAAVDAGLCERSTMIGQTGVTVSPKLYIAVGISGQLQHTAGIKQADTIISINRDADAAMNKMADYAVVGDAKDVVTKLIAQLSKMD